MTDCKRCEGTGKVEKEWTESEYEEYLDDAYGEVTICGMKFSSGRALRELDPVAFRCGMNGMQREDMDCPECEGSGIIDE